MTPEGIPATIEGMLRVPKELQQSQIKQSEEIQQLMGYSISQAGDVLDVQMSLKDIYARLSKLEDKNKED
ncbi:MAG TPA: hypothetical protein V6C71_10930 [Coleofasciculaceae cyanobacterium]|jgi:hypothetical protein